MVRYSIVTLDDWVNAFSGSYPSSCDPSRAYTDIPAALKRYKQYPLLEYMKEWWKVGNPNIYLPI